MIITGEFNCRSSQWWENDIEKNEGRIFEPFATQLGLHQLISEPTHFMGDSKSCIDLILTDQPNLFIESGVRQSLHEQCHHQIVYGKLSVSNITTPPYTSKVWYYDKADFVAIRKSIEMFDRQEHLDKLTCPNEQVKFLNEVLLNIYSNFIPNKVKTIRPCEVPWITKPVKNFLRKKNRAYKNFVRRGQPGLATSLSLFSAYISRCKMRGRGQWKEHLSFLPVSAPCLVMTRERLVASPGSA